MKIEDFDFGHGVGDYAKHKACIMSARVAMARIARGEDIGAATDQDDSACPVVRRLLIRRNDATPESELKPWALAMLKRPLCCQSRETTQRRAEACARYAVTVIAPEALRRAGLVADADRLAAMPSTATMIELRDAAYAAYAADAAAYAAYAAADDAADADAAAYAAAYAAYAAAADDAADAAAAYAAVKIKHLDAMIEIVLGITDGDAK